MIWCIDCGMECDTGAYHENYPKCIAALHARIDALEAENERLREALEAWEHVGGLYADDEGNTVIEARRLTAKAREGK